MSFYGGNDCDPEDYSVCPFDSKHLILNKRMAGHLVKCARNFVCADMETCPYNARHVYPRVQHQHHLLHCPDRAIIDREIFDMTGQSAGGASSNSSGNCSLPSYDRHDCEAEENWDDDSGRYFNAMYIPHSASRLPSNEPVILEGDRKSEVEKRLQERRKVRMVNTAGAFLNSDVANNNDVSAVNGVVHRSNTGGRVDTNGVCSNIQGSPVAATAAVGYGRGIPARPCVGAAAGVPSFGRGRDLNRQQLQRKVTVTPAFALPGIGRGLSPF